MNKSKEYYSNDSIAKDYDKERFTSKAGKMFDIFEKEIVLKYAPNDSNSLVLDAGAGTGRFTIELAKKGYKVVSCDQSDAMLRIIESKVEKLSMENNVTLSKQDITNLSFDNDTFDFVDCMRVFVNLDTKKNILNALTELSRVCKSEGTILFDIVNPRSLARYGPQKESMLTMSEMEKIIASIEGVHIEKVFGRRILTQRAFEKTPELLLQCTDKIDYYLSKFLPSFCVRIYFVLRCG